MPPLAGVVHAAGVREDGVLAQLDEARMKSVLAPKVAGAWNLHRHTADLPLDFFVLFSSAASVLPSPAQGTYAAANAFLDGLARYRRAQGLPAISVNWGPWDDIGMAAGLSERDQKRWARHGVAFISPDDGARAFEKLTASPLAQVAVVNADWRRFSENVGRDWPWRISPVHRRRPGESDPANAGGCTARTRRDRTRAEEPASRCGGRPRSRTRPAGARPRAQLQSGAASGAPRHRHGLADGARAEPAAATTGKPLPATLTFDRPTALRSPRTWPTKRSRSPTSIGCGARCRRRASVAPRPLADEGAIAIVGIGCRFGNANDGDAFWQMLHDGVDAIREILRIAGTWTSLRPEPEAPGKMYTRFAASREGPSIRFFGISPRETISLDPQQRLLLEVAWEALEHASQPADRLLREKAACSWASASTTTRCCT